METFLIIAAAISIFWLGMATGAIIENRRIRTSERLMLEVTKTREILLPLPNKIEHIDCSHRSFVNGTLVDYNVQDPDSTMEIPVYEKLIEETWHGKKQKS